MTIHSDLQVSARSEVAAGPKQKPHLVVCAAAASGHTLPMAQIAAALVKRGYTVSFLTSKEFASQVERAGAELVPTPEIVSEGASAAANSAVEREGAAPTYTAIMKYIVRNIFLNTIPACHEALKRHLEHLAATQPGRQVILLLEVFFLGAEAFRHGAPLPRGYDRMPRSVGFSIAPMLIHSIDTAPIGPGLPPDSTPSGRLRNALLNKMYEEKFADLMEERAQLLRGLGATRDPNGWILNDWMTAADVTLQTCSPSIEYERSDLAPSIRFIGALPARPVPADLEYPAWWPELNGKKVVAVAQGTVSTSPHELLAPTLRGLAEREDLFVVALLGIKGASLPPDIKVPANARVLDYFPYQALLARADVFVHNAGYGGVQQSIMAGVPLVAAGQNEDKAEMSMRIQCAGVGYNLATSTPTPEQVRDGVDEVLTNPAYRQRVLAMKKENEDLDALARIEAQIVEFTE
ncbi:hypothetical protein RB597_008745 [Gaeumannomyces tritici]